MPEKEMVMVQALGARKALGRIIFKPQTGWIGDVALMEVKEAERLIINHENKDDPKFCYAVEDIDLPPLNTPLPNIKKSSGIKTKRNVWKRKKE